MVSTGYKGPKVARGLHPSGYWEVLIHNVQEVSKVDSKTQAARIAHTVGKKKRAEIIAEAKKKKVVLLNAKEVKEAEETDEEGEEKPEEELTVEAKTEGEKNPAKKKPAKPKQKPKAKRRGLSLGRKKE